MGKRVWRRNAKVEGEREERTKKKVKNLYEDKVIFRKS